MEWFYRLDGQELGPVSTQELKTLFRDRTITAETPIRQGRHSAWKPLQQYVREGPPPGSERKPEPPERAAPSENGEHPVTGAVRACTECGRDYAPDELIWFDEARICAACKPQFIQKLRAAVPRQGGMRYAGFRIRLAAKLIDALALLAINMTVGVIFLLLAGGAAADGSAWADESRVQLVWHFVGLAYTTFFLGRFGATPGKMACRLRVVSPEGGPIGYGRALARALAEYLSSVILMIGYIMAAFDAQKRALHDRICRTRVVLL